ncbi:MAG: ABC transporter ATP-binding protein [Betaproteobacteria bacterium]|nr:ABC transporter ATP-binding protein [Betaproteobacteria bacterium]MDE2622813.1 ABC transporter ATP-binding protein [Betaproteobacteria bacterium]
MAMLLSVRNLQIGFQTGKETPFEAVRNVSFDLPECTTVALVGESGSGKSVTALSILGLLPNRITRMGADSRILWRGKNLLDQGEAELRALRGREIAMIFQEPMSSLNPVFTVGEQLMEGLRLRLGMSRKQARTRALELLSEVGIPEPGRRLDAYPHQLSGGQQQRVMIAMAISCQPSLLIADEPTTALDVTVQRQILELIRSLQQRLRMSVLFITHDLALVNEIASEVVVMKDGQVREAGSREAVFSSPEDAYTKALLACRPPLGERPMRLRVIDDFLNGHSLQDIPLRYRGSDPADEIVLEVKNLEKGFPVREGLWRKRLFRAVRDVSFQVPRGKTVGVVGESGSGKTTLGLTVAGLLQPDGGEILFRGENLQVARARDPVGFRRRIQIVFQNPYASLNPRFTVGHILTEPLLLNDIGGTAAAREKIALELLSRVGLPRDAFMRYPHEFSGGQRQRIAIARCLSVKPEVLICDESVSALDVSVQAQVLNLLQDLQDEYHMSYVFISHDLSVVRYMSDQVLVMHDGAVVESGDADELFAQPRQPYTQELLSAVPKPWNP